MKPAFLLITLALFLVPMHAQAEDKVESIEQTCASLSTKSDQATCSTFLELVKANDEEAVGDVDVFLESVEDNNGQLVLSRKRAKHMRTWARILDAESDDVLLEKAGQNKVLIEKDLEKQRQEILK